MNHYVGSGHISKIIGLSNNKKSFMYQIACKDTHNLKQEAEFITCVAFGKNATWCDKWLKKGTLVNIEGKLRFTSKKQDDGSFKNYASVVVSSHELIGGKKPEAFTSINEKEVPIPNEFLDQIK